jgi:hypothetical protein
MDRFNADKKAFDRGGCSWFSIAAFDRLPASGTGRLTSIIRSG